jgi:plasmid stabilization system protein ParE
MIWTYSNNFTPQIRQIALTLKTLADTPRLGQFSADLTARMEFLSTGARYEQCKNAKVVADNRSGRSDQ